MSKDHAFKLRFEISAKDHDRLAAAFLTPAGGYVEKTRHLSVYLDTPEGALRERDLIWCFSRKDKLREGRLKPGEWRLGNESDARSFVKKNRLRHAIGGVFTMRLDRIFLTHTLDQTSVDISLETVHLRSGDQSLLTIEAEFVLRDGSTDDLLGLVGKVLPNAVPVTTCSSHVERGYALAGMEPGAAPASAGGRFSKPGKNTSAADVLKIIVREEIACAMAVLPAADGSSVEQNLQSVRRVRSAFGLLAKCLSHEADLTGLAGFQAALEKAHDLDTILTAYVTPASRRGRWDSVAGLVARIEESRARAYVVLAQNWSSARVKSLYSAVAGILDKPVTQSVAGSEPLVSFLSRELAKACEDVQALGAKSEEIGNGKLKTEHLKSLSAAVTQTHVAAGLFEPLATGKSASRRWSALQEALGDLRALLEKESRLDEAQVLVADAAAHVARMKQTKTQIAQTYAAGALAGFLEALKEESLEKELKKALTNVAGVKPFWSKLD